MTDFREFVDPGDLSPEEEARLRRVHELLQCRPARRRTCRRRCSTRRRRPVEADVVQFPLLPRRRLALAALVAAAPASRSPSAAATSSATPRAQPQAFAADRVVPMHGHAANAVLRIAPRDSAGNWPMQMEVQRAARSSTTATRTTSSG